MAEFQLRVNVPKDREELLNVIRFIQQNPEGKRSEVKCPEHGNQIAIIIDNGPEQPITFTGCCQAAIDKRRIGWVTKIGEGLNPNSQPSYE
jgi:hypothetical protein